MIEDFSKELYPQLQLLWRKRKRPEIPFVFLPATGIAFLYEENAVAFGFLTRTDTPLGLIGNLVTDPEASGALRDRALNSIISALEQKARLLGIAVVSAAANQRGLVARYSALGYTETDRDLSALIKIL